MSELSAPATTAAAAARARSLALAPDGTFEGYASLFNVPDLGRDVVLPGAFRDSLRARGPRGIKMLFQHDPATPIGVWADLVEDARGLYARGRLTTQVTRASEILALIQAGASMASRSASAPLQPGARARAACAASPASIYGRSRSSRSRFCRRPHHAREGRCAPSPRRVPRHRDLEARIGAATRRLRAAV